MVQGVPYLYVITKKSAYIILFFWFYFISFSGSRIPLCLLVMFPWTPLGSDSFSDFLIFGDLEGLGQRWLGTL